MTGGGRTYTYHLKRGVMWDTTPARQVTATDEVRGIEMLCNPASPTGAPGYYESTISVEDDTNASAVHDDGLIYNYWLEGIGRRNAPVTSFAGYHSARQAAIEAKAEIERLIDPIPAEFLARMGGGR